ncbi:hypothetical protein BDV29DRAFT_153189 [Aspergillus leporis]|uniref:Uncharacterized protein n=1 Tax=Aspergillus leporis TaxID=41062 RepID=A0A5N5XAY9_9EURO|nr:hypothetical protein BDV29DRAFT_153189 [Aspergillus leporis]
MTVSKELAEVQRLVAAEAAADANARGDLLKAIRALQLAVNSEKIMQNISIYIDIEKRFLQLVATQNGKPLTASEIATQTGENVCR